jgi:hypothetical protein
MVETVQSIAITRVLSLARVAETTFDWCPSWHIEAGLGVVKGPYIGYNETPVQGQ